MAATEPAITYMKPPNRSVEKIKKRNAPMPPTAKHRANAIEISVGIAPLERSPPESQTMPSARGWSPILRKPTGNARHTETASTGAAHAAMSSRSSFQAPPARCAFAPEGIRGRAPSLFGRALQPGLELLLARQQD